MGQSEPNTIQFAEILEKCVFPTSSHIAQIQPIQPEREPKRFPGFRAVVGRAIGLFWQRRRVTRNAGMEVKWWKVRDLVYTTFSVE